MRKRIRVLLSWPLALRSAAGFIAGLTALALTASAGQAATPAEVIAKAVAEGEIVDLSVTISENYPNHFPGFGFIPMQRWIMNWYQPIAGPYAAAPVGNGTHGKDGNLVQSQLPFYGQRYVIDDHTGTQIDYPAHVIPPPGQGLPSLAGPVEADTGWLTGDRYPLDRLMGPAVVIDIRSLLNRANNAESPQITVELIQEWEKRNGAIRQGEVVLFYSGYVDQYYRPFPEGNRMFLEPAIARSASAWPAPTAGAVEYFAKKGVRHIGIDSPTMFNMSGPDAHVPFLKTGGSFTEFLTNLGKLPARGAYYISVGAKIVDSSGGLSRAFAIKPKGVKGVGE
jgi:kynurenine formamidase